jgi:hypothetical protein
MNYDRPPVHRSVGPTHAAMSQHPPASPTPPLTLPGRP